MLKNLFLVVFIGALLIISGCKKSCGLNCLHAGSCDGTVCSCPDPYSGITCDTVCTLGKEGYMCQTLSREKFIGTWSIRTADQSGNIQNYLITLTNNPYELFMNLNNFNNGGAVSIGNFSIVCTLTGKTGFSIDANQQNAQATAAGVLGSGVLSNGKLTINIYTHSNSYFCTATKQ